MKLLVALVVVSTFAIAVSSCGRSLPTGPLTSSASGAAQDPRTVGVDAADLQAGLSLCPASGDIDRYLQRLEADGSPSYEVTSEQWAAFKQLGANAGWVTSFAQSPEDCSLRLGERKDPSAISFAIRFKEPSGAVRAFGQGFLGLRPANQMSAPGLVQGPGTQLAANAWTYDQTEQSPNLFVAFWVNRDFALFLLTEHLPAAVSRQAASSMNLRVR